MATFSKLWALHKTVGFEYFTVKSKESVLHFVCTCSLLMAELCNTKFAMSSPKCKKPPKGLPTATAGGSFAVPLPSLGPVHGRGLEGLWREQGGQHRRDRLGEAGDIFEAHLRALPLRGFLTLGFCTGSSRHVGGSGSSKSHV